jgi:predicted transcriptional regulator
MSVGHDPHVTPCVLNLFQNEPESRKSSHPVAETSMDAYIKLIQSGRLSKLRQDVLLYIAVHPGCTSYDIEQHYHPKNYSSYAARLGDLCKEGLLVRGDKVFKDGAYRYTYKVTGNTEAADPSVDLSYKERLKICVEALVGLYRDGHGREAIQKTLRDIGYITATTEDGVLLGLLGNPELK